ncbi:MAG: hypothetical protein JNK23_00465 [Opitutaceae bacterium]|nr:hypothetical protein [Opitutaceae bacterium]
MSPPRAEAPRANRVGRWLLPAALLAFVPKCLLCAAAYAGLGAALGLGGPELCGASSGSPASWPSSLAWAGAALGIVGLLAAVGCRRRTAASADLHG